jgi:putative membrane protein
MRHSLEANKFFTEEEKRRIKETTKTIEKRTIGEVAVMVVDSSDRYREAEIAGGVFLCSLLSMIVTVSFFYSSLWFFIPWSFLFFFPSQYIFQKFPLLKIGFIGLKRREQTVMQRAVRAFYEKGLYKTRKNTGVLFFLSLLERKVWVLADKGIYEKIEQETLNKFANIVSNGIKDGRACNALCEAMRQAGELLAKHFPIKPGDIDELPDEVIAEK